MMPYNFKVWAHPLEMMSASWQGDRVPNVDVGRILENLLENRDDVSWGPNNKFKFPLLGTGMLYDRMAEALPKPVNLREEVVSIDPSAKLVTFASGRSVSYDFLINTMPIKELVKKIIGCPEEFSPQRRICIIPRVCLSASAWPIPARAQSAGCTFRNPTRHSTASRTFQTIRPR